MTHKNDTSDILRFPVEIPIKTTLLLTYATHLAKERQQQQVKKQCHCVVRTDWEKPVRRASGFGFQAVP